MKNIYYLLCLLFPLSVMGQEPTGKSQWIYPDASGKLVYKATKKGDRIIDFSHAGYKGGGVTLPYVPAKLTVHPLGENEDCTDYIQKAIDMVSALPKDENGFRGAVLLAPGRFVCERTIQITADGVVLRGTGSDPSGSTIVIHNYSCVENLRIESPAQAVNHGKALYYALRINGEDCWAKDKIGRAHV